MLPTDLLQQRRCATHGISNEFLAPLPGGDCCSCAAAAFSRARISCRSPLRAKIAETTPLALITEQGENRNQREKQWILCELSARLHEFRRA